MAIQLPTIAGIRQEFTTPLYHGHGRRVTYFPAPGNREVMLGTVARLFDCFYVTGPDFAHSEEAARQVLRTGHADQQAIDQLNDGLPHVARMHRASSQEQAIELLCKLVCARYGRLPAREAGLVPLTFPLLEIAQ